MRKGIIYPVGRITTDIAEESKSLEEQLKISNANKEPLRMLAKLTYNDRKDGVLPQHDIRTDRFEIGLLATDKIHMSKAAQRQAIDFPQNPEELQQAVKEGKIGEA